jgi:large subunit ribosomal protein L4
MSKKITIQKNEKPIVVHDVTLEDLDVAMPTSVKMPKIAFAISLRVLKQNWRQGTVSCKGRADVARSGKKPWKQKGTGRARAGTSRSPLWRGGGVTHGPQPRVHELKITKQVRKNVFSQLFVDFIGRNKIMTIDHTIAGDRPRTKYAWNMLQAADVGTKKVILFATPDDHLVHASFANIKNVHVMYFDQPNVYDLSIAKKWIFLKKDIEQFKGMVKRWL